jgi:hypothetical protein
MQAHDHIRGLFDTYLPKEIAGSFIKMNSSYESGLCGVLG